MEVQACAHIAQSVVSINDDPVSHIRPYLRNRPLVVDANDGSLEVTIRVGSCPADVKVICDGSRLASNR
jgi:hypothetical protein